METAPERSSEEVTSEERLDNKKPAWEGVCVGGGHCSGQRGLQVQRCTGGSQGVFGDHLGRCGCSGGSAGKSGTK